MLKDEDVKLYLALSKGENFGWGVCSKYLNKGVSKLYQNTIQWDFENDTEETNYINGKVFHALTSLEFESITTLRGTENYGYTFFENELNDKSIENAKKYDIVFGGSTWNKQKMLVKGIKNSNVLFQGIDPELFFPIKENKNQSLFVIFSGGKFELRKGQDIVLKAVKILQEKYPDIILINAWYNLWPKTMELMQQSTHIKVKAKGSTWQEFMSDLYYTNKLDGDRIITLDVVDNKKLRNLYAATDLGVFPNRCEGGTNLVLMEYMACGKPVVATYATGHTDVLSDNHALLLKENKPFHLMHRNRLWADWVEPSLDELVAEIEYAYFHRDEIKRIGKNAGEFMKKFTWEKSAETLLNLINI